MAVAKGLTGILTSADLSFIGTDIAGEGKKRRTQAARATRNVQNNPLLQTHVPSSGGFTILGTNAFGQDIARSNITGRVSTVDKFNPISPESRALGESKSPLTLAKSGEKRKPFGSRTARKPVKQKQNTLGTQSILGSQSILG